MKRRWLVLLLAAVLSVPAASAAGPDVDRKAVETYLAATMERARVPGLAAAIVGPQGSQRFFLGYFAPARRLAPDAGTSFELGSNSKAFTALAAMLLVERGQLDLDAPVDAYLPWLTLRYEDRPVTPRVRDFVYHTSGLPFQMLGAVQHGAAGHELEATVRRLAGRSTLFPPGERFAYATVNYDVVGLLVERASGRSFDDFVRQELFQPLGLKATTTPAGEARVTATSDGHKLSFLRARPFAAAAYPGHAPAAYVYSTLEDMERWAGVLLGTVPVGDELRAAVERALQPNRTVPPEPFFGALYAGGWYYVDEPEVELSHPGSNPAFSSCVALYPQRRSAVVVLANLNSYDVMEACADIHLLTSGGTATETADLYRTVDLVCTVLFALAVLGCVVAVLLFVRFAQRLRRGEAHFSRQRWLTPRRLLGLGCWLLAVSVLLYTAPRLLFQQLPWRVMLEWGPGSLLPAVLVLWLLAVLLLVRRSLRAGLVVNGDAR